MSDAAADGRADDSRARTDERARTHRTINFINFVRKLAAKMNAATSPHRSGGGMSPSSRGEGRTNRFRELRASYKVSTDFPERPRVLPHPFTAPGTIPRPSSPIARSERH